MESHAYRVSRTGAEAGWETDAETGWEVEPSTPERYRPATGHPGGGGPWQAARPHVASRP